MKVLIICTEKLPVPAIKGGAIQTYIDGALPVLKQKHQITVLGREDESLPGEEIREGVRYVRVEGGILESYRENVVQFLQADQQSYDIIHIFNRPRLVNKVRQLAPDAKIILSMHNDMFKPEKLRAEEGTLVVQNVDRIITISQYIGQTIRDFYPEAAPKIQTIYSGVDLDRFVPSYSQAAKEMRNRLRSEHGLEGKKVILYAGRLSANKGIDVLVRAIPALAEKHDNIALVIMGSKWFSNNDVTDYIAYVRALAERLPVPVIQTGFVAPDKIQEWFAASDIFVCTSQWQEPLARVHYEAMAAALPIVTTDRGGNTEVIEPHKNGIIVENPADPGEFVQHLSYLLSNSGIGEEMGRYGRSLAEKHYTWGRVVSDILSAWQQVERAEVLDIPGVEVAEEQLTAEVTDAVEPADVSAEEIVEEPSVAPEPVTEETSEDVIEEAEDQVNETEEIAEVIKEDKAEEEAAAEESENTVQAEEVTEPVMEEAEEITEVINEEKVEEEPEEVTESVIEEEAIAEVSIEEELDSVEAVEEAIEDSEPSVEEKEEPEEAAEYAEEQDSVEEELELPSQEEEKETSANPVEEKLVAFTNVMKEALGSQDSVKRKKTKNSSGFKEYPVSLNANNKENATNLFLLLALFYMKEKKWI
ncbi:glycosyltransferase family 4 protein [Halobacillus sp. A5]|uniref:glycosyltransferase family 4 protein n=1 Tax=Halobacillus sp. A5 TaxID=2880263 RepID=UPI0020A67D58|nr:glycosyltransferase [Halobacillus sp. A5]MCP3029433.1 glycosyltransferase [Halobacillus sp. A5]